eukprot:TRINITY_DN14567_c0_g1_i1.p1 TRINITY_DN14567_c0_g1~~TRINITY_DN14567_c0_g1_i1.p1  ORF type:complete len:651 (+),score=191.10 TRINITY_DN14567_c0_g1_i1:55-2007(+)
MDRASSPSSIRLLGSPQGSLQRQPSGKRQKSQQAKGKWHSHALRRSARAIILRSEAGRQRLSRDLARNDKAVAAKLLQLSFRLWFRKYKQKLESVKCLAHAGTRRRKRLGPAVRVTQCFCRARLSVHIVCVKHLGRGVLVVQRLYRGLLCRRQYERFCLRRDERALVERRCVIGAAAIARIERMQRISLFPAAAVVALPQPRPQRAAGHPLAQQLLLLRREERAARQAARSLRTCDMAALADERRRVEVGRRLLCSGPDAARVWAADFDAAVYCTDRGGELGAAMAAEARERSGVREAEATGWFRLQLTAERRRHVRAASAGVAMPLKDSSLDLAVDGRPRVMWWSAEAAVAPEAVIPSAAPRPPAPERQGELYWVANRPEQPFSAQWDDADARRRRAESWLTAPPAPPRQERQRRKRLAELVRESTERRALAWGITPEAVTDFLRAPPAAVMLTRVGCVEGAERRAIAPASAAPTDVLAPRRPHPPSPPPRGGRAVAQRTRAPVGPRHLVDCGQQGLLALSPCTVLEHAALHSTVAAEATARRYCRGQPRPRLLVAPPAKAVLGPAFGELPPWPPPSPEPRRFAEGGGPDVRARCTPRLADMQPAEPRRADGVSTLTPVPLLLPRSAAQLSLPPGKGRAARPPPAMAES